MGDGKSGGKCRPLMLPRPYLPPSGGVREGLAAHSPPRFLPGLVLVSTATSSLQGQPALLLDKTLRAALLCSPEGGLASKLV